MENNHEEIKFLDIKPGNSFTANGKRYTVSESFAIGRFEMVEQLEEELSTFSDRRSWHDIGLKVMEHINSYRPGEAYTLIYNKIQSDQKNARLNHYTLRLCCAYINYEGEDVRYLTEEQIKTKLVDWSEESLDMRPFLLFAVSVFNELLLRYRNPIVNILAEAKPIKEALDQVMDMQILMANSGQEMS